MGTEINIRSLGDLKKSIQAIESKLTAETGDPLEEFQLASSWIDYVKLDTCDPSHAHYLLSEGLPKLALAALKRRYSSTVSHQEAAKQFIIESTACFAAYRAKENMEGIFGALNELLDPNQAFYVKYGFEKKQEHRPNATSAPAAKRKSVTPKPTQQQIEYFNSLERESVFDYLADSGRWEYFVVVAAIKATKSDPAKLQIAPMDGSSDMGVYVSADTHAHRVAEFYTKVGQDDTVMAVEPESIAVVEPSVPPSRATTPAPDGESAPVAAPSAATAFDESLWRQSLGVGDMVDACDKNNVWQQACVVDVKLADASAPSNPRTTPVYGPHLRSDPGHVEVIDMTGDDEQPFEAQKSKVNKVDANGANQHLTTDGEKHHTSGGFHSIEQITHLGQNVAHAVSSTVHNIATHLPHLPHVSGPCMSAEDVEVMEHNRDALATHPHPDHTAPGLAQPVTSMVVDISEVPMDENAIVASAPPAKVTLLRITYIGQPERFDEWIDAQSTRLQPLNTLSQGRRGDNPVREEIIFLAESRVPSYQPFPPNEMSEFAVLRDNCFFAPLYVQIVNAFGKANGFANVLDYLHKCESATHAESAMGSSNGRASRNTALDAIVVIGRTRQVLTKSFLSTFAVPFIQCSCTTIRNISTHELRNIPVEKIEAALHSLDAISVAHYGRNPAAGAHEDAWLATAVLLIESPYLNKRLGGLKLVTDLVNRAYSAVSYPSGLRTTRLNSAGEETVSYRVIPILYSLKAQAIFSTLESRDVFANLFKGEHAHYSIFPRTRELLRFLARENTLHNSVLEVIWSAGYSDKKNEALQLLVDLVDDLPVTELTWFLQSVILVQTSKTSLSNELIDLLHGLGIRARRVLLRASFDFDIEAPQISATDEANAMTLHYTALHALWKWSSDEVGVPASLAAYSTGKIESIISTGISTSDTLKHKNFPWGVQWARMKDVIGWAHESLKACTAVSTSVRILQACICVYNSTEDSPGLDSIDVSASAMDTGDSTVPVVIKSRSDLGRYMEASFGTLQCISHTLSEIHRLFQSLYQAKSAETQWSSHAPLPIDAQVRLNESRISTSKVGYRDLLDSLFTFLHVFARCSDTLVISQSIVEEIWHNFMLGAVTQAEAGLAVNFIERTVKRTLAPAKKTSVSFASTSYDEASEDKENSAPVVSSGPNVPSVRARAVVKHETAKWIFHSLLCDHTFLRSSFFTDSFYMCVEKFWRWVNALEGFISEKKDRFLVVGSTDKLIGLEVFFYMATNCQSDTVATKSVLFLTSLPSKLSSALLTAGETIVLRKFILDRCMGELKQWKAGGSYLRRLLSVLNGLLDESFQDASAANITPHMFVGAGAVASVKINWTTKELKHLDSRITIHSFITIEQLLGQIANLAGLEPTMLKALFGGKDISRADVAHKTAQELKIEDGTTIVVARRPLPKSESLNASGTDLDPSAKERTVGKIVSIDSLPAVVLAQSPEYVDLLFDLIDNTSGDDCDATWDLLCRLPTIPSLVHKFLSVADTSTMLDVLLSNSSQRDTRASSEDGTLVGLATSPARLLYNIQVVKIVMQLGLSRLDVQSNIKHRRGLWGLVDVGSESVAERILNWTESTFLVKEGVDMLIYALNFTQTKLDLFISSNLVGITSKILLQTAQLVTTMLRPFLLSGALLLKGGIVAPLLMELDPNVKSDAIEDSSHDAILLGIEEYKLTGKEWGWLWDDAIEVDLGTGSCFTMNLRSEGVPRRISEAVLQSLLPNKPKNYQVDFVKLMVVLRRFADLVRTEITSNSNSNDSSQLIRQRDSNTSKINTVVQVLSNLFILWGAIVSLHPAIVFDFQFSESLKMTESGLQVSVLRRIVDESQTHILIDSLLQELLLGFIDERTIVTTELTEYAERLGKVSVDGLLAVLNTIFKIDKTGVSLDNKDVVVIKTPYLQFRRQIFLSLLNLRPSLVPLTGGSNSNGGGHETILLHTPRGDGEGTLARNQTFEPLFQLASSIVEGRDRAPDCFTRGDMTQLDDHLNQQLKLTSDLLTEASNDPVQTTLDIYEGLVHAFQYLFRFYSRGERPPRLRYVEGTLKLFSALLEATHDLISLPIKENMVEFFLTACLGLGAKRFGLEGTESVQSCVASPVLCNDEASRNHAYTVLRLLSSASEQITTKVFRHLVDVHNSVEPPSVWSYNPDKDSVSSSGFVGLRNMGCTCYMNSLLQIMYMIPVFRNAIISAPVLAHTSDDSKKNDYLLQLKKVFLHLNLSEKKFFSPDDWIYANKDETGVNPIDVTQQQDSQEFLQLFCDRLENSLQRLDAALFPAGDGNQSSFRFSSLIGNSFGGNLANLMILNDTGSTEMSGDAQSSSIREQEESFVCISLDVKGCQGLEDSLHKFVQGEQIGDFQWDDARPRASITKRQCISRLSDSVIFHLKRFELDYATFTRGKVNDKFPFPEFLNMEPFTKAHILGTKTDSIDEDEYQYVIGGILIHSGTSDSGHYFSYIRENGDAFANRPWWQFDDSEIRPFHVDSIPSECFGGTTVSQEVNLETNQMQEGFSYENTKNAYMLVYHRVRPKLTAFSPQSMIPATSTSAISTEDVGHILDSIKNENEKHAMMVRLFAEPHMNFNGNLINAFRKHIANRRPSNSAHAASTASAQRRSEHSVATTGKGATAHLPPVLLFESVKFAVRFVNHSPFLETAHKFSNAHTRWLETLASHQSLRASPTKRSTFFSHGNAAATATAASGSSSASAATASKPSTGFFGWFDSKNKKPADATNAPNLSTNSQDSFDSALVLDDLTADGEDQLEPASALLGMLLEKFDATVMATLFAPDSSIRTDFALFLLRLLTLSLQRDGEAAVAEDAAREEASIGLLSTVGFSDSFNTHSVSKSMSIGSDDDDNDDVNLARALQMSTELSQQAQVARSQDAKSPTPSSTSVQANVASSTAAAPSSHAVLGSGLKLTSRFIVELTIQWRIVLLAENWRRADALTWLLSELVRMSWAVRTLLAKREIVSQLMDIFLGESSPLSGRIYMVGSRKRAPSSYVSVGPLLKNGEQPYAAKNIPDWTKLIETVAELVERATVTAPASGISNWLHAQVDPTKPVLPTVCGECLTNRVFLSTILRQARYAKLFIRTILQLSFSNIDYTNNVIEVIIEVLNFNSTDNAAHIFELVDAFVMIADVQKGYRCQSLVAGPMGIFEFMRRLTDQPARARDVCVYMFSILTIVHKHKALFKESLATPLNMLQSWAPWMLKFVFQFREKCNADRQLSTTIAASAADANAIPGSAADPSAAVADIPAVPKGPYLIVYGESEEDRELSWDVRAERTFALLQAVITGYGGNPDELIPEDSFVPQYATMDVVESMSDTADLPNLVPADDTGSLGGFSGDAMTDEQFARFLSENPDAMLP